MYLTLSDILSVINALKKLGYSPIFIRNKTDLDEATHVIFPGVGAFGPSMKKLSSTGLIEPLKEYIASVSLLPLLCLGQAFYGAMRWHASTRAV
jgi:glutamine amidotransferase/cyclase